MKELEQKRIESELEAEAVELVRRYSAVLMMAPPVKAFFKRLAVYLKWEKLERAL